ncbi:alkaline phosphatase [Sphingomonas oleivorans]|uniref:Alkaline phosphatase n=1 Tax=Sphingomonas oleivorans TaxID=1735121 RepID=A0A2T5G1Q7_9SPHN|nr:alkaline phosphatase D family protein [Sphingomonas oleivorans]PTQ13084.1 alkaline phosphatase [Sphingomonas oleivorans]
MTNGISRRGLIGGAIGGAALLGAPAIVRAQQLFADYPFRLGIASGDPSPDGFVIWTRLAPDPLAEHGGMPIAPMPVTWEIATEEPFRNIIQKGEAIARPELGHAVHVEVTGLEPGRPYWYRFSIGRERTVRGRAKTLPANGAAIDRLRFGVAGCQHYEDGLYTAYRHLAAEEIDFVYHYGDYIYESRSAPIGIGWDGRLKQFVRTYQGGDCLTIGDYRRRYAQTKMDPDLQAAHASAAFFATFDDHEVQNNWVQNIDGWGKSGAPAELFALRRAAAFQAYYEHMPLRRSSFPAGNAIQLYRRARFGNLLDMHFLDTRQFRSDQPCDDGFKPICADVADGRATVLGDGQEKWLAQNLRQGGARWNALAQQIMMMPLDRRTGDEPAPIRNMDSWGGYDSPRERLFASLKGLGNVVALTGDEHQNFAGELRTRNGTDEAVAVEFVSTSISSGGSGSDKRSGAERIMADNPFLKFSNDQRGYLLCEVTPDQWSSAFRVVDKVHEPGGQISTRTTLAVERGKPALVTA